MREGQTENFHGRASAIFPPGNDVRRYLSAWITGIRLARHAGKNPPTTPITTENTSPSRRSSGVTRNANAISLKLAKFVVLVTTPLIGSASRQPITPPTNAITADSARKLASTLRGWNPSVRSTAISGVRELTAAYIVF